MSERIEIRHRETGEILFSADAEAAATPGLALGLALAAAVAAGVDLAGAELRDVDARGAGLRGAKLAGACLTGAMLDGCDLSGAMLSDATMLRVSAVEACFDRADLGSAHAWAAVLTGASFRGANAVGANFDDSVMERCDLRGADLTEASLLRVNLTGAELGRAALDGADLRGARMEGVRMDRGGTGPLRGDTAPEDGCGGDAEAPGASRPVAEFHWQRRWLVRAVPGAAAAALLAGGMAWQIAAGFLGAGASGFGRTILAAMFATLALALGGAAITYLAALFRREAVVTLDAAGIRDSRISAEPIPWDEITAWLPVLHGGQMMLMMQVAAPRRFSLSRNPLWASNRLCSRWLGRPELAIRMTGLEGELEALLSAIQANASR